MDLLTYHQNSLLKSFLKNFLSVVILISLFLCSTTVHSEQKYVYAKEPFPYKTSATNFAGYTTHVFECHYWLNTSSNCKINGTVNWEIEKIYLDGYIEWWDAEHYSIHDSYTSWPGVYGLSNIIKDNEIRFYEPQCDPGSGMCIKFNYNFGTCPRAKVTYNQTCEEEPEPEACVKQWWYLDKDGDGVGTSTYVGNEFQCSIPKSIPQSSGVTYKFVKASKGDDECDYIPDVFKPVMVHVDEDKDGVYSKEKKLFCPDGLTSSGKGWCLDHKCTHTLYKPEVNGDCNDNDPKIGPKMKMVIDNDGDGYYVTGSEIEECIVPPGYKILTEKLKPDDCDDDVKLKHPGSIWIRDRDGDGYYNWSDRKEQCEKPKISLTQTFFYDESGETILYYEASHPEKQYWLLEGNFGKDKSPGDCTDLHALMYPDAQWIRDWDDDGYYKATEIEKSCQEPTQNEGVDDDNKKYWLKDGVVGKTKKSGDCDDKDELIYPNAAWIIDKDGDGFYNKKDIIYSCNANKDIKNQQISDRAEGISPWFVDLQMQGQTKQSGYMNFNEVVKPCLMEENGCIDNSKYWLMDGDIGKTKKPGDCDDSDKNIQDIILLFSDKDFDGFGDPFIHKTINCAKDDYDPNDIDKKEWVKNPNDLSIFKKSENMAQNISGNNKHKFMLFNKHPEYCMNKTDPVYTECLDAGSYCEYNSEIGGVECLPYSFWTSFCPDYAGMGTQWYSEQPYGTTLPILTNQNLTDANIQKTQPSWRFVETCMAAHMNSPAYILNIEESNDNYLVIRSSSGSLLVFPFEGIDYKINKDLFIDFIIGAFPEYTEKPPIVAITPENFISFYAKYILTSIKELPGLWEVQLEGQPDDRFCLNQGKLVDPDSYWSDTGYLPWITITDLKDVENFSDEDGDFIEDSFEKKHFLRHSYKEADSDNDGYPDTIEHYMAKKNPIHSVKFVTFSDFFPHKVSGTQVAMHYKELLPLETEIWNQGLALAHDLLSEVVSRTYDLYGDKKDVHLLLDPTLMHNIMDSSKPAYIATGLPSQLILFSPTIHPITKKAYGLAWGCGKEGDDICIDLRLHISLHNSAYRTIIKTLADTFIHEALHHHIGVESDPKGIREHEIIYSVLNTTLDLYNLNDMTLIPKPARNWRKQLP